MKLVRKNSRDALTLVEVLSVIVVVAILALVLVWSNLPRVYARAPRIACVNSLKQVGLAFRLFGQDNNDKYPMQVSITNGGAMEPALEGNSVPVFQVMSNELNTPKILCCPADEERSQAKVFGEDFRRSNISYFVNLDATGEGQNPSAFLCGDRNLSFGKVLQPGIAVMTTNQSVAWAKGIHSHGRTFKFFNLALAEWDVRGVGNCAFADGSAQSLNDRALNAALSSCGVATNRLVMP